MRLPVLPVALLTVGLINSACGTPPATTEDSGPPPGLDASLSSQGTEGAPCFPNGTCMTGLNCEANVCVKPEQGTLGGPCFPNGTCMAGLTCQSGLCRDSGNTDAGLTGTDAAFGGADATPQAAPDAALSKSDASVPGTDAGAPDGSVQPKIIVVPAETYLLPGVAFSLKAEVFTATGAIRFPSKADQIPVDWTTSDPAIATVDRYGTVTALDVAPVSITATVRGTSDSFVVKINPGTDAVVWPLAPPNFTDVTAVFLDPSRMAIDVGSSRRFNATAIDRTGAPTTPDCYGGPTLAYQSQYFSATWDSTLGAEGVDISGLVKGYSLLTVECGGFVSPPAIVEVKPSVTIPDPSPSAHGDFGHSPALAIRGQEIHIASYDSANHNLVYSHFQNVWTSAVLDGSGDYGQRSAIVLDPSNAYRPLVVATEDGNISTWLRGATGFWTKNVIEIAYTVGGSYDLPVSVAASPTGTIHVLYHNALSNALVLATSKAAARNDWTTSRVADGADHGSLALAPDGTVRIAYRKDGKAWYSQRGYLTWIGAVIDGSSGTPSPGTYIKLAIGDDNQPQVVYYKNGNLIHALKTGGQWLTSVIESANLTSGAIGLDLNYHRQPRISYYDSAVSMMRFAYRTENGWRIDSPSAKANTGSESALAVDEYGRAQIAFYDSTIGRAGFYVEPYYLSYFDIDDTQTDPLENTYSCTNSLKCFTMLDASNVWDLQVSGITPTPQELAAYDYDCDGAITGGDVAYIYDVAALATCPP